MTNAGEPATPVDPPQKQRGPACLPHFWQCDRPCITPFRLFRHDSTSLILWRTAGLSRNAFSRASRPPGPKTRRKQACRVSKARIGNRAAERHLQSSCTSEGGDYISQIQPIHAELTNQATLPTRAPIRGYVVGTPRPPSSASPPLPSSAPSVCTSLRLARPPKPASSVGRMLFRSPALRSSTLRSPNAAHG